MYICICIVFTAHIRIFFAAFRNVLLKANRKLNEVLVEVLKTTAAAEETLGLHMQSLSDPSRAPNSTSQRAAGK